MRQRTAKELLLLSWLLPMVCTLVGSAALAFGLSYLDYANNRRSETKRLEELAPTLGRRVSAEILLKDQGTLGPVIEQLKTEYSLRSLTLLDRFEATKSSAIRAEWKIPLGDDTKLIVLEREPPAYSSFIQLRHFLLALLPSLLMAALGFALQSRFLRTHFIQPVEALAETSLGERAPDKSWPVEIQAIAYKLSESFSSREQAVFGRVAKGIIHDIRTNLHSMGTATQLVEGAKDPQDRQRPLEKLYSACTRNIPKIRSIVDLSLDSSREISMKPELADVSEALEQAMDSLAELAISKGVQLSGDTSETLLAVHDPLQLERVVLNLVKNAIEATDQVPGNKVVRVGARKTADGVLIEVEDSGHGLSDPGSVFRPLKSSKTHGVGLGLFVSKKIVEAHSGRMEAGTSADLGGAKFTVHLPEEVRV